VVDPAVYASYQTLAVPVDRHRLFAGLTGLCWRLTEPDLVYF